MPRQPRYQLPGIPQHITQRGNNRQSVFFSDQDYLYYLGALNAVAEKEACLIHAYVLMTNHIHILATPTTPNGLSRLMQGIGRRYVAYINKLENRSGTLWEGRYKASLVGDERYLLSVMRYIEMNPVRAGLVKKPGEYRWSSYRFNAEGEDVAVKMTPHESYLAIVPWASVKSREVEEKYRQLFRAPLEEVEYNRIKEVSNSCLVYGSDSFKDEVEKQLRRSVRPGRVGRPKVHK